MTLTTAHGPEGQTDAEVAEGVRRAIAAYCHALDDGRVDDLVALFTSDGKSALPGMDMAEGHDALRALYRALVPQVPQRHLVFNTVISHQDDGRIGALSDLVFLSKSESGWTITLVGRYDDLLRREGRHWRFEHRALAFTAP
ncbi:hypothetical protein AXA44_31035 [Rhodococcus sp. SC4]|uniref:nuclear transport factor 2 family protein n=1 Tax=unclassified Rhodococcus (in: high G+C Gram-positive bacteria) TaxID=192944 RepID=UPI00076A7B82|nr:MULTISPECIES: nuclear transport factor 2 family protein [unclassified Rhodococcus (in: high G+C Gram-positive bacteria)]KXF57136.1 hypothetical protein AXA44_31035 [Rhodococcus sp. SC4]KXX61860.1 hypothetical protein AZG88_31440 [Rhodococcus sp. LB1]PBC56444.1 nuclear transport factor 2 family protein [Rhodococcus sp. ACPA1]